jgi:hypothetical protein
MEIKYKDLIFYYRLKKVTPNQRAFIEDIVDELGRDQTSVFEFPPTLDKDFLYNSVLFALANRDDRKFIIVVKDYDKIYKLMKNFSSITSLAEKYTGKTGAQIVPFFDRKSICLNEKALESSSNLDFDSYCTSVTASWLPKTKKCNYYLVSLPIYIELLDRV